LAVGGWNPIRNASWQNVETCSSNPYIIDEQGEAMALFVAEEL
jgi:hypothetical protein